MKASEIKVGSPLSYRGEPFFVEAIAEVQGQRVATIASKTQRLTVPLSELERPTSSRLGRPTLFKVMNNAIRIKN